jgi:hypothetical protein
MLLHAVVELNSPVMEKEYELVFYDLRDPLACRSRELSWKPLLQASGDFCGELAHLWRVALHEGTDTFLHLCDGEWWSV